MTIKLRNKILLYFGTFILLYLLGMTLVNSQVIQKKLVESARQDLRIQLESVFSATESLVETAISNYLRGALEMTIPYLEELNGEVEKGVLTLDEAKLLFQGYVNNHKIGESGYIVAIQERDEQVFLDIHPFLRGSDATETTAATLWLEQRNGYSVYDWQNPEDATFRRKVAYLRYYEPWDWILGATTYEDELYQLINVEDLRGVISSFKIKENGYFYLMDSQFVMRIHPTLEGQNVYDMRDPKGVYITHEMLRYIGDFYEYLWLNPATGKEEKKYALVQIIKPFDWYVVAAGYVSDITKPIKELLRTGYVISLVMGAALIILVLRFSRSLTLPMDHLIEGLNRFYQSRILFQMQFKSVREIESVGRAIEKMTSSIKKYETKSSQLTEQLNGIINSMPSMLIGVDREEHIIFLNNEAVHYTGKKKEEVLNQPVMTFLRDFEEARPSIRRGLESGEVASVNIVLNTCPLTGEKTFFEVTVYPLNRDMKTAVLRIDDVTERTNMEEMLLHSRKMDAIGQLAGGVAHDFNNMLTAILHSIEYLKGMTHANKEAGEYLDIIEQAALRAADLTQKLLTFSRKANKVFSPQNVQNALE